MPKRGKIVLKIRLKLLGMLGIISAFRDKGETEVDFIGNTVGDLVSHLLSSVKLEERRLFLNEQGGDSTGTAGIP